MSMTGLKQLQFLCRFSFVHARRSGHGRRTMTRLRAKSRCLLPVEGVGISSKVWALVTQK